MRFVLDTNTLTYFFRGDGRVAERLLSTSPAHVAIPTVVLYELETGIAKSSDAAKRRGQLDQLLQLVVVLPFGAEEAKAAAALRARLESAGTPIGPIDTLIAGTAMAHRGVLVTRNVREFARVPGRRSRIGTGRPAPPARPSRSPTSAARSTRRSPPTTPG